MTKCSIIGGAQNKRGNTPSFMKNAILTPSHLGALKAMGNHRTM